ncbi:peptidoglycan-binding protein [Pendulispora albinea]|uniref:Peptidoglycan-binding protein n=1 Tax=Pendulispora albinea TaxID=2741071 RepID=A0ABZ2MA80_9BACT
MQYTIVQGDCLSSVASRFGFHHWRVIYDHPKNASFREKRPNPNLIYPGDELFIPEKEPKSIKGSTGKVHTIVVQRPMAHLRLRLSQVDGSPVAGAAYTLRVGWFEAKGTTSDDGFVEQDIPSHEAHATLSLEGSGVEKPLQLGSLDPIDTVSGVQARLRNLGYDCGPIDGIVGPKTKAGTRSFQRDNPPLAVDGVCGPKTRAVLLEKYGC